MIPLPNFKFLEVTAPGPSLSSFKKFLGRSFMSSLISSCHVHNVLLSCLILSRSSLCLSSCLILSHLFVLGLFPDLVHSTPGHGEDVQRRHHHHGRLLRRRVPQTLLGEEDEGRRPGDEDDEEEGERKPRNTFRSSTFGNTQL